MKGREGPDLISIGRDAIGLFPALDPPVVIVVRCFSSRGAASSRRPAGYLQVRLPMLWTIGHSTRPIDDFLDVLEAHRIELVADVRRFPGSRRLPQYGAESLAAALEARGIAYLWIPELGGRRRASGADGDDDDSAWRHPAFRAYAAHVASEEFAEGLFTLLTCAHGLRTAVMCAEVLWWRCHRRLIADVAVSLGMPVGHIRDAQTAEEHRLTAPARIVGGLLSYAAARRSSKQGKDEQG